MHALPNIQHPSGCMQHEFPDPLQPHSLCTHVAEADCDSLDELITAHLSRGDRIPVTPLALAVCCAPNVHIHLARRGHHCSDHSASCHREACTQERVSALMCSKLQQLAELGCDSRDQQSHVSLFGTLNSTSLPSMLHSCCNYTSHTL